MFECPDLFVAVQKLCLDYAYFVFVKNVPPPSPVTLSFFARLSNNNTKGYEHF